MGLPWDSCPLLAGIMMALLGNGARGKLQGDTSRKSLLGFHLPALFIHGGTRGGVGRFGLGLGGVGYVCGAV